MIFPSSIDAEKEFLFDDTLRDRLINMYFSKIIPLQK